MRIWSQRRGLAGLMAVGVAVGALGMLQAPASARGATAHDQVFLIQGTPGVSVDISLDGRQVARDAPAKDIVGPLTVSPGRHTVRFGTGAGMVPASFMVSRTSTDVVLHLPAQPSGRPVVTVYTNDLAPLPPGNGRLVIAHTAVVPPADLRVDGKVLFSNIANGEFVGAVVAAKTYSADLVPTGQKEALFGPVDISVRAGALTRVFAIGQPTHGGMDAIVQVIPVSSTGSSQPTHVNTGSAGLVATPATDAGPPDGLWIAAAGLGALLAMLVLRRRAVG